MANCSYPSNGQLASDAQYISAVRSKRVVGCTGKFNDIESNTITVNDDLRANKFVDATNVKYYGAVGDGVTDDTAAVNDAFNAVERGVINKLCFPTGTYLVDAGRQIVGTSNFTICGDGMHSSIIKLRVGGNSITFDGCTEFTIRDLQIDCNATALGVGGQGLVILDCKDYEVKSIKIDDWGNSAILAYARNKATFTPSNGMMRDSVFTAGSSSIQGPLYVDHEYSIMDNVTVFGPLTGSGAVQLKNDCQFCVLRNIYAYDVNIAVGLGGDTPPYASKCKVENVYSEKGNFSTNSITNCTISNVVLNMGGELVDAIRLFNEPTGNTFSNIVVTELGGTRAFVRLDGAAVNNTFQFDKIGIPSTSFAVAQFLNAGCSNNLVIVSDWFGSNSQWIKSSNTINNYIQLNNSDASNGVHFENGPIYTTVTIATGSVNVPTSKTDLILRLIPETGTTDTLDKITGGSSTQKVYLVTNQLSADVITLANGTALNNLFIGTNRDIDNRRDMLPLVYRGDYTAPLWRALNVVDDAIADAGAVGAAYVQAEVQEIADRVNDVLAVLRLQGLITV